MPSGIFGENGYDRQAGEIGTIDFHSRLSYHEVRQIRPSSATYQYHFRRSRPMTDKKQPLILIVVMTIIGIGIAYALWVFAHRNIQTQRDQIFSDLHHIAADAHQFRHRPSSLGGGGGSFTGYRVPDRFRRTGFASYDTVREGSEFLLSIRATSVQSLGEIIAEIDSTGVIAIRETSGEFAGL